MKIRKNYYFLLFQILDESLAFLSTQDIVIIKQNILKKYLLILILSKSSNIYIILNYTNFINRASNFLNINTSLPNRPPSLIDSDDDLYSDEEDNIRDNEYNDYLNSSKAPRTVSRYNTLYL